MSQKYPYIKPSGWNLNAANILAESKTISPLSDDVYKVHFSSRDSYIEEYNSSYRHYYNMINTLLDTLPAISWLGKIRINSNTMIHNKLTKISISKFKLNKQILPNRGIYTVSILYETKKYNHYESMFRKGKMNNLRKSIKKLDL